jgi:hypothetical protein
VIIDERVTCLMPESVNFKCFVSVNFLYFYFYIVD